MIKVEAIKHANTCLLWRSNLQDRSFESWMQFMKKFIVEESKQLGADHWVTSVRFLHARVYDKEFILVCEL